MNVAEIDPLSLPSLTLSDRKQLPSCPAIYAVLVDAALNVGLTMHSFE